MTTQSQRYNCFIRNGGNAIPKHAGPEAKGSNPTAGLTLLWARNPFRENFKDRQISRKEIKYNLILSSSRRFALYVCDIYSLKMYSLCYSIKTSTYNCISAF